MMKAVDYYSSFPDWPNRWKREERDVEIGKEFLKEFEKFIDYLTAKGFSKKTIKKHMDYLFLLGGQLIDNISSDEELRDQAPLKVLYSAVSEFEGPYCDHLESESEMKSFDATCKKLWKFHHKN